MTETSEEATAGQEAPGTEGSPQWRLTLATMVAVQLIMSISFTFLAPVLPLFLPDLGVAPASAVYLWAGLLASMTSFVAVFTSPFWGRMADRHGRKLMVLRSSFAIAICTLLMGLSQSVWQMLALRALMGAFAGFTSASVVLVVSQVPERRLGYALGLLSTGQLVGSLVGPMVGGVVADVTGSYRIPFFVAGAVSLVAFALCWWLVPERFTKPTEKRRSVSTWTSMRAMTRTPGLAALVLVLLLTQFAVQAIQPIVTLYVQELVGPLPNLATLGGFAFSATGLAGVLAVPVLGRGGDAIGYRRVLLVSLAGAALLTAPQAFVGSYWGFVAERFGVGLFVGGILPTANALIGRLAPASDRGLTYGMTSSAYFLGNSLGPITGGVVGATIGLRWVFLVTATLLFANLVWVYLTVPERFGSGRDEPETS
jgi:MFS transporter, DHA1 family, multidrug resistance protein